MRVIASLVSGIVGVWLARTLGTIVDFLATVINTVLEAVGTAAAADITAVVVGVIFAVVALTRPTFLLEIFGGTFGAFGLVGEFSRKKFGRAFRRRGRHVA